MRHKFLVLTVKKWLKSVYIYRSYCKIKTGVSLFLDHCVYRQKLLSSTTTLSLDDPAKRNPVNIRMHLIFPVVRVIGLHFCRW